MTYQDPGDHRRHVIYLHGPWYNGSESLRHSREATDFEDYLALKFSAKSVNAVFRPEGEAPGPFEVLHSGRRVPDRFHQRVGRGH